MKTRKQTLTTPQGFAQLIVRGVRANFAPEYQRIELDKLVNLFNDMAMSRGMKAELKQTAKTEAKLAQSDELWLGAIADELDEVVFQMKKKINR
jgi:hypothetical protein